MNPILQKLNSGNNALAQIINVKNMLQGNPNAVLNQMMNNPQFKQFYNQNKDKTVDQIANEYGLDINQVKALLK